MKYTAATKTKGLIITKTSKQKLTKNQQEFNKLTVRIEKLQKEIQNKQLKFELAVKEYGQKVHPQKTKLLTARRGFVIALWQNYKLNKLAKVDQQVFRIILQTELQTYLEELHIPLKDAELKEIFFALEGVDYDKMLEKEKNNARKHVLADLKKMKVDVSDIDTKDIDALYGKMQEHIRTNIAEDGKDEYHTAKKIKLKQKSEKQKSAEALQEEIAAAKQKNIATIYKQLAKLFHPDLEQVENRKQEKVLLMQELTAAYEAKNLHALLTLELRWIHKENDHLETLSEDKLAVYLQILKEQISELEEQKNKIFYLPQFSVLREEYGWQILNRPLEYIQQAYSKMNTLTEEYENNVTLVSSPLSLKHIKAMVKDFKRQLLDNSNVYDYFEDDY